MKVNHKQMYLMLKQQANVLQLQLTPGEHVERSNEIPENFNQIGWDATIEKVGMLFEKLKEVREVRGKRLTPQFYRSIYNRANIGINEINKLLETLTVEDEDIDYELECMKLTEKIYNLNKELSVQEEVAQELQHS